MTDGTDEDIEYEGIFDFIWETDTEVGREMSEAMERSVKRGEATVEVVDDG